MAPAPEHRSLSSAVQATTGPVHGNCLLQMWKKLLEPTLKLQLDASNPSADALQSVRILRCRITAICATAASLQACLRKACEGLKAKLKPGPMCAALQQLLAGAVPDPTTLHEFHKHIAYGMQSLTLAA
jgi:hypothetical protein